MLFVLTMGRQLLMQRYSGLCDIAKNQLNFLVIFAIQIDFIKIHPIMKVIFNSKIAKVIIPFHSAILLFFWLLCKKSAQHYRQSFFAHEHCHSLQWQECMYTGFLISFIMFILGLGFDTMIYGCVISVVLSYILYGLNYIGNLVYLLCKKGSREILHTAYRMLSFEREARYFEFTDGSWEPDRNNIAPHLKRKPFGWIKFIGRSFRD